ncbi:unnamed protein product [Paramecium sonneborni]|uniref:Uncharacterized protein n=1 Tax=Paramecium sonneborni TaxID=65129 RepID=A0A8S1N9Q0_9CILI|nr:unnamed protein product [Paramecium sonneborni]
MVKQCYLLVTLLVIVLSQNYGTVLIQNEGGGQIQSKEILFQQPFQQIPQVAIALLNGQGDIFAEIHEVNQEGFTLQVMASDEIEAQFAYLAIDNDENYQIECFNRVAIGNEIQIPIIIQRPTFISVLATNTHANNFNIDLLDGNLIVDNDGQMNMCIIITNEEQPIDLVGYQNYQQQEVAEFHPFKKQNAMSLVQAQQSLEITHLDQQKSFEIWHHQSIEIVKDSSIEVYPTHRSLEIVSDDQPNQVEFKQNESLEIFKLENQDLQSNSDQKLIAEDIHLENIDENLQSQNNQIEDIKFNDHSNFDNQNQQQITVAPSDQLEDIKLDLESTQENQQSETISLDDSQQLQVDDQQVQQQIEDSQQLQVDDQQQQQSDDSQQQQQVEDSQQQQQVEDSQEQQQVKDSQQQQQIEDSQQQQQIEDSQQLVEDSQQQQQVEDSQQKENNQQQQFEDVKIVTEEPIDNQNLQEIKLTTDEVQIIEPKNDSIQNQEQQNNQQNQDESNQILQSNSETNNNDQVLQQEDIAFDNQENNIVNQEEEPKQEIQIEDIKLDNTEISSMNADDIPQQQDAKEILHDQLSIASEEKQVEDTSSTEDVVIHADEVKIENVKISEANLDEISIEQQDNIQQVQEDIQESNNDINEQSEVISVDPEAFSEPQQKVTQINDEDLLKQEQDIDEMIRVAQELREEAKQLKNKNRSEQQLEKLDIMEKANDLEKEVGELENKSEEPQVVEDQISLDVNSAYEDQKEVQIEQPKEEQQPPIIYLNDEGMNPEQQLIIQEIKNDDNNLMVNQLQDEVDKELQSQEQQIENTSQIGEEDIQIIDASIKLDEDHQEIEVYESGQVEAIPDQVQPQIEEVQQIEQPQEYVEQEPQEDVVQEQESTKEEGGIVQEQEFINKEGDIVQEQESTKEEEAIEIGLTTDEGEAYIRKPKKSDFLREKQRLKDKLNNVIRDFKLDSVSTESLDTVAEGEKQYSLIIDRLDVPENNDQVIVLKDEDYEQNYVEPEPIQEVKQLGDYLEAVEPNIENINFIYDDEQQQEQQNIQIEDIKLHDDTNEETNYKIVEAKDDDFVESTLEYVDDTQQQQLLSSEVAVSAEETSVIQDDNQNKEDINVSFDEFQQELEALANTIGNIKQENVDTMKTSDYIIVNDNSQIYEATYDEQSNEQPIEDEPQIEENQEQYYQGIEDDQNTSMEIEQSENLDQEQQELQQPNEDPELEQQDIEQPQLSEDQFLVDEQQSEDATQQVQRYDDAEPQEQYLTIDNLVKDSSVDTGESYQQPPQYYDESDNQSCEEDQQNKVENTFQQDYDVSEQQQQAQQYQNNYQQQQEQQEQEQDFVVMKANQFIPQQTEKQAQLEQQLSDNQKEEDIYSETPKNENEIDIIIDVANEQQDQSQQNEQDYDYEDNFEVQQPVQKQVESQSQQKQDIQQQQQQLQQDSKSTKNNKQKIQHSITISHNPQQSNSKQTDRSIQIQHEEKSLKIEHQLNEEELKKNIKEQLKQELKEELKQEIKQEIQESHNRRKSASLVIEDNVAKDPERPAQKAINNFNNLLHDVVDETLKEEDRKHYQKLPIVDLKKESFNKVEPKMEQGIEDLKKALGLKGGVEVIDNNGKKQVINVEDLKKESEKLLTNPEKENKNDSPQYEEFLRKVTEKQQKNNNEAQINYEEQHNLRKQEILENIKRELEIKKGHFTIPNDSPQAELSPYEFERVYLDWEKNKQDIIPSILQHSIEQPNTQEIHSNQEIVQQKSIERVSRKEEVDKEVQELLYGNQKNRKQQSKQSLKEFKVEDLKYIKDDPLLDSTFSGFVQVKANLRRRQH